MCGSCRSCLCSPPNPSTELQVSQQQEAIPNLSICSSHYLSKSPADFLRGLQGGVALVEALVHCPITSHQSVVNKQQSARWKARHLKKKTCMLTWEIVTPKTRNCWLGAGMLWWGGGGNHQEQVCRLVHCFSIAHAQDVLLKQWVMQNTNWTSSQAKL